LVAHLNEGNKAPYNNDLADHLGRSVLSGSISDACEACEAGTFYGTCAESCTDSEIEELYDWEAEPGENVNRAQESRMKRTRDQLRDELFAWYNPERNPYRRK